MIAGLVAASALALANPALQPADPIGDLLQSLAPQPQASQAQPSSSIDGPEIQLQASLYHAGASGVGAREALGCKAYLTKPIRQSQLLDALAEALVDVDAEGKLASVHASGMLEEMLPDLLKKAKAEKAPASGGN